ncbi:RhoGAP-domain-containing protein [Xylona heveae TC161]|uniref:RhoGAP-domain-containing protein n=1 Tax=Xylona heveae (strain CBS 132557 / TC161) TaxID=1328760 RepID=A0A165HIA6_XYLHT|nr:RhoGAP-domain-containing protein [Xylona heveae TC161]KZF23561.1 RhoGAP-domain-containing protein [Xylona heveae TC161]
MATKNQPPPSARHNLPPTHAPAQPSSQAASPPSKRDLISWWRQFKKNAKREEDKVEAPTGIFGVPLQVSIRYANVAISLTDGNGQSFIYGYVPIIVAKCGVYLKEKATTVEGIFRLSGSAKRIKDLQTLFDSPDRYGKGLDWSGYTVHDAANILRRYLNQLPEPIIPLEFYDRFREPLRTHQTQAVGDLEAQNQDSGDFDYDAAIKEYQQLITELPPLNRQLLLYILDLLAVFASKSDINRMTAANLAAIFQPGMLSHPQHDMAPPEYRLCQNVLVFLIENQDNFLIGMSGTAADEKTVKEVQSGPATPQPGTPSTPRPGQAKAPVVRTASNASAGADSVRRFGGVRRNVSVSSRNSKQSTTSPSPASPAYGIGGGSGVHRSNTVPSKRSPALASHRFNRHGENAQPERAISRSPVAAVAQPPAIAREQIIEPPTKPDQHVQAPSTSLAKAEPANVASVPFAAEKDGTQESAGTSDQQQTELSPPPVLGQHAGTTPIKERGFASIFSKSPSSDTERKEPRPPNKLRKKRAPGSANPSAQSSTNSLHGNFAASEPVIPPGPVPELPSHPREDTPHRDSGFSPPVLSNTQPTPPGEESLQLNDSAMQHSLQAPNDSSMHQASGATLRPAVSPTLSYHSHSSITDHSDMEQSDDPNSVEQREKRRRWRLSFSPKSEQQRLGSGHSGSQLGSQAGAEHSTSTVGSYSRARRSLAVENQSAQETLPSGLSDAPQSNIETASSSTITATAPKESEKKGPIDWFRGKLQERKEREAEKERAKSPPPDPSERGSRKSLAAAVDPAAPRQKSLEDVTEEGQVNASTPPTSSRSDRPQTQRGEGS